MHLATKLDGMYFPLHSDGTTISLTSRTPTEQELPECVHIQMSLKLPWDPHTVLQFPDLPRRAEAGVLTRSTAHVSTSADLLTSPCADVGSCAKDNVCPCPLQIVELIVAQVRVPEALTDVPGPRTVVSLTIGTPVSHQKC